MSELDTGDGLPLGAVGTLERTLSIIRGGGEAKGTMTQAQPAETTRVVEPAGSFEEAALEWVRDLLAQEEQHDVRGAIKALDRELAERRMTPEMRLAKSMSDWANSSPTNETTALDWLRAHAAEIAELLS